MKTFITGANGFVGKNLRETLTDAIAMDRSKHDFFRLETLSSILSEVDCVVHLAGVNAGTASQPDHQRMIRDNLDATSQLIKGIRLYAQKKVRVVFLSSLHVYESGHHEVTERTVIGPHSSYGIIKYAQELLLRQAADQGLIELVIFRATHIYGPQTKPFYNSGVATLCYNALRNKPIQLHGNGFAQLDLIYVDDVVCYILKAIALNSIQGCEIYNLASGNTIAIREVADEIENILGKPIERDLIDNPIKACCIDTSKLIARFGNLTQTKLRDGLRQQLQAAAADIKANSPACAETVY